VPSCGSGDERAQNIASSKMGAIEKATASDYL